MFEPVSLLMALAELFGEPMAKKMVAWAKGSEVAQLVRLLKKDFPMAKGLRTQPEALGALWYYAKTGQFQLEEMVSAVRPLTDSEDQAIRLAEAIRDNQWRAVRKESQLHFECLRLADQIQVEAAAGKERDERVERSLERLEQAIAKLARELPAARQLPAQTLPFVDREKAIKAGEELLSHPPAGRAAMVINLSGMAGMGKSALALELAYRQIERFPAGALYVELRAPDGHLRHPGEVAGRLLRDLGVSPEAIPRDPEERLCLLRSTLAERPVLLVLDNAESEAQVRDLIPPAAESLVLITSRAPLAIGVEQSIDLEALADGDAALLFESIVGKRARDEPDAVATMIARCGGLPLALVVLASRTRRRPAMPLSAFLPAGSGDGDEVEALDDPRATLRTALVAAIDAASAGARRLLLLLASLEATEIDPSMAGALVGIEVAAAAKLIEELGDARLLLAVEGGGWRIHSLMRATAASLARKELGEEEIASAQKLRVDWLVSHAKEHVRDLKGEV
jgi:hypothetical protein